MPIDFIQGESPKVWMHIFSNVLKKMTKLIKLKTNFDQRGIWSKQKERELDKDYYAQKITQIDWV